MPHTASQPSASADSQPWIENTVSDPWLVESEDVKPGYGGLTLYLLRKICIEVDLHSFARCCSKLSCDSCIHRTWHKVREQYILALLSEGRGLRDSSV